MLASNHTRSKLDDWASEKQIRMCPLGNIKHKYKVLFIFNDDTLVYTTSILYIKHSRTYQNFLFFYFYFQKKKHLILQRKKKPTTSQNTIIQWREIRNQMHLLKKVFIIAKKTQRPNLPGIYTFINHAIIKTFIRHLLKHLLLQRK